MIVVAVDVALVIARAMNMGEGVLSVVKSQRREVGVENGGWSGLKRCSDRLPWLCNRRHTADDPNLPPSPFFFWCQRRFRKRLRGSSRNWRNGGRFASGRRRCTSSSPSPTRSTRSRCCSSCRRWVVRLPSKRVLACLACPARCVCVCVVLGVRGEAAGFFVASGLHS